MLQKKGGFTQQLCAFSSLFNKQTQTDREESTALQNSLANTTFKIVKLLIIFWTQPCYKLDERVDSRQQKMRMMKQGRRKKEKKKSGLVEY